MKNLIGLNSGKLYTCLKNNNNKTISQLRRDCKLSMNDTYAALGWLAREGKITFNQLKSGVEVVLISE